MAPDETLPILHHRASSSRVTASLHPYLPCAPWAGTPPGTLPAQDGLVDPAPRGPVVGNNPGSVGTRGSAGAQPHGAPCLPGVVTVHGEGEGSGTSHGTPGQRAVVEDVAVVDAVREKLGKGADMGLEDTSPGSERVSPPCHQHPESFSAHSKNQVSGHRRMP